MKRPTNSFYLKFFGRLPPRELLEPIKNWSIDAHEARQEILRQFLGADSRDVALHRAATTIFPGLGIEKNPRVRPHEVHQAAALISLGKTSLAAAKIIRMRQNDRRSPSTIKRDFESAGLYKSFGKFSDHAQIALTGSGLLDRFKSAFKEHSATFVYFDKYDEDKHWVPPTGLTAALYWEIGLAGRVTRASTLAPWIDSELRKQSAAQIVVVDRPGGNVGPIFRSIFSDLGFENVVLLDATGPLVAMETPAVVALTDTIPPKVVEKADAALENQAKERARLRPHTGPLSAHAFSRS